MTHEFLIKILKAFEDKMDEVFWRFDEQDNIQFYVMCSDVFMWGCSDCEELSTQEDLDLYNKCQTEIDGYKGSYLYCARKRKIRPQGAFYTYFNDEQAKLFNECGEERKVDFGNPYDNKVGKLNDYHKSKTS